MRILPLALLLACSGTGPSAPCERAFWLDADGDGFGGREDVWIGCEAPPAYVEGPEDCDDADPTFHPEAEELCDGLDNDCDGDTDEQPYTPVLLYLDDDNDGFGSEAETRYGCPTLGWVTNRDDCDDGAVWVNPGADETCDGIDRDCDGHPFLGAIDGEPWFKDNDGDGFGRQANATTGCGEPDEGWVLNEDDCDDTDEGVYPGAPEGVFDGEDADCDGLERCPLDGDGDGFGGGDTVLADLGCTLADAVGNADDCDDADPAINPDADELWYTGVDEDCDPVTRDDDLDEDGALLADDCDDLDPLVNPGNPPPGAFTEIGLSVGLDQLQWDPVAEPPRCAGSREYQSGGAAVADYDGDGDHDLFLPRVYAPDLLYRQLPDGSFEEVGASAGVDWPGASNGALWVDIDADRDLDLAVLMVGAEPNRLYVNDGAGGFTEEGALRGFDLPLTDPTACALQWSVSAGDVDGDGDLDLHTTAWQDDGFPGTDRARLLVNDGAGFFTDATLVTGLGMGDRAGLSSAFVDPDDDGEVDLALTADWMTSALYRNAGGTFDPLVAVGVGTDENGAGAAWGDVDGDGDLDWFVSGLYDASCAGPWGCSGNRLYRNDGFLVFTDITDAAGVRDGGWGAGAALFDLDHDGDLDLVQQNGSVEPGFADDALRLFLNDGTGAFSEEGCTHRTDGQVGLGRGVVPFDADADGDLDLLLSVTADRPRLLRNEGAEAAGAWLRVHLSDPGSANPYAVGATVRATPSGGAAQVRLLHANSSFASSGPPEVHFGLGTATAVDLEITWPDGAVQLESAVPVDQQLVVTRAVP